MRELQREIRRRLSEATVSVDPPAVADAAWWVDVEFDGRIASVEWRPGGGFGVAAPGGMYGEGPDYVFADPRAAAEHIARVLGPASYSHAESDEHVGDMKQIADLIEGQTLTVVEPSCTVRDAAERMTERNVGAVVVVDAGTLAGIFSERDIMRRVVAAGLSPHDTSVASVMTKDLVVAEPRETVDSAIRKMYSIGSRHLPVVDDGKLVGMISIRDLLELNVAEQRAKSFLSELVTYSPNDEADEALDSVKRVE